VRVIAVTPDRFPALEAEMLDDLAPVSRPEAGSRELLKAGRRDRAHGDGGGFAAGGVADAVPPGPALAGFAADAWAAGLG